MDWENLGRKASKKWEEIREGAAGVREDILCDTTFAPRTGWDYLAHSGTVLAALMLLQAATGVLLFFDFRPNPSLAFASHLFIRNDAAFGLLISNIHTLGAKLIVLLAFVHMIRLMWLASYRGPRAFQWYTGIGLLTLLLFTGFSGYLLPWSQQSFWACVVGTEALKVVPVLGPFAAGLLRGGDNVAGPTLSRFYVLHVFLLPAGLAALFWYHVKGVWKTRTIGPEDSLARADESACIGCGACERTCPFSAVNMVEVAGQEKPRPRFDPDLCNACRACVDRCPVRCISLVCGGAPCVTEPIYPHNVLRRAFSTAAVLFALFFAAYFLPALFIAEKTPADPMLTPEHIKPDWYFLGPYQVLKVMPSELTGLAALFAVFMLMVFLPKLDPRGPRDPARRPLFTLAVKIGVGAFVIFTLWGWVS